MEHIRSIWCICSNLEISCIQNVIKWSTFGIKFVSFFSFFEWSSDILRKMDFSSVWRVNKAVLIDTSSALKVKIENFWSFLLENSICGLKNARVGHILKLLEIFLTEWNPFALLIEPNDLAPLIVHSSVPCRFRASFEF